MEVLGAFLTLSAAFSTRSRPMAMRHVVVGLHGVLDGKLAKAVIEQFAVVLLVVEAGGDLLGGVKLGPVAFSGHRPGIPFRRSRRLCGNRARIPKSVLKRLASWALVSIFLIRPRFLRVASTHASYCREGRFGDAAVGIDAGVHGGAGEGLADGLAGLFSRGVLMEVGVP